MNPYGFPEFFIPELPGRLRHRNAELIPPERLTLRNYYEAALGKRYSKHM
jgi:hypothetical protein